MHTENGMSKLCVRKGFPVSQNTGWPATLILFLKRAREFSSLIIWPTDDSFQKCIAPAVCECTGNICTWWCRLLRQLFAWTYCTFSFHRFFFLRAFFNGDLCFEKVRSYGGDEEHDVGFLFGFSSQLYERNVSPTRFINLSWFSIQTVQCRQITMSDCYLHATTNKKWSPVIKFSAPNPRN